MSIKFENKEYRENISNLIMLDELYIGNDAVKKNGSKYLIRHELEEDAKFESRLKRSSFYNYFKEAIDDSTSKLFRKPPEINYKAKYKDFFENINGKKENLEQFLMDLSTKVQKDGYTYVWVDAGSNIDAKGWKPYFSIIDRADVINTKYKRINGEEQLIKAVLKQSITIDVDEYETKDIIVYIDITKDRIKFVDDNEEVVKVIELNLTKIPLVKIKSGHNMPYLDLATLNLDHYNIYSDLRYNLHMSNTPMYVFFGLEQQQMTKGNKKDAEVKVGVNKALSFGDKQVEGLDIVESEGRTIETSRNILKDIKEEIIKKTSSIVNKNFKTATEANLHDKNSNLLLVDIAINLEKGITECLSIAEEFYGQDIGFSIKLNKEFNDIKLDSQTMFALNTMVENNSIPLEIFWDTLIEGDILSDFNYDKAKKDLIEQKEYLNQSLTKTPVEPTKEV